MSGPSEMDIPLSQPSVADAATVDDLASQVLAVQEVGLDAGGDQPSDLDDL